MSTSSENALTRSGAVMRAQQPVLADVLRQGRRAVVFAFVVSVFAAVPLLAAPLFIWHVVDVALRQASFDTLLPIGALVLLLLGARVALLAARDHVLTRVALWFRHVAERQLLTATIGTSTAARQTNLARRAVIDVSSAATVHALKAWCEMTVVVVATAGLFAVHPWFGVVGTGVLMLAAAAVLVVDRRLRDRVARTADADERAAEAFRVTAHNAGALAHHGLGDGMINDWQTLHAVAVTHAYRADRIAARAQVAVRCLTAMLPVLIGGVGAWLVMTAGLAVGAVAAGVMLAMAVSDSVQAAVAARPDVAAAQAAVIHLTGFVADGRRSVPTSISSGDHDGMQMGRAS